MTDTAVKSDWSVRDIRFSIVASAVIAAVVGYASTIALVVAAARAVNATPAQTSSWFVSMSVAIAATSFVLSWKYRMPIVTAWSLPGLLLVAASTHLSLQAAVGAFVLSGALMVLTAAFRPIATLIARIPTGVASAMMAGMLFRFAVAVFEQAQGLPGFALPLIGLYLVIRLLSPPGASLAVVVAGVALAFALGLAQPMQGGLQISTLTFIAPSFEPAALIGIGLPLYLVTMASQNLPGFAVLKADGYQVPARAMLVGTGLASILAAFFLGHSCNASAITASICTGPDAHPDRTKRWLTAPFYAVAYLVLALFAASLVAVFDALPPALVTIVAGLALLAPLTASLGTAIQADADRLPAVLTFTVTASGLSYFHIGSAFWGLVAGLLAVGLDAAWKRGRGRR